MKYLVFDAGPLISLTMNGLLQVIENLKKNFLGEFIITSSVKYEVVDRPIKVKRYKLEAIKIQDLIDKKVLKIAENLIPEDKLRRETQKILRNSDSVISYHSDGKKIKILQEGEASCLAFCNLIGADSMIIIDERTTRFLIEKPEKLEELMEKKLHTNLDFNSSISFRNYKIIRSAELLYIAYKKDLTGLAKNKDSLDAMLYGVKFKGTAISVKEIEAIKQMSY